MCFELVLEKELEVLSVHNCDISLYKDTVGTPALDAPMYTPYTQKRTILRQSILALNAVDQAASEPSLPRL